MFLNFRLIRISPFANRLSFDAPPAVQRLRCLANFEALKFSKPITAISNTLVSRMRKKSAENNGKYVAVHLRFEEVSFLSNIYSQFVPEQQNIPRLLNNHQDFSELLGPRSLVFRIIANKQVHFSVCFPLLLICTW